MTLRNSLRFVVSLRICRNPRSEILCCCVSCCCAFAIVFVVFFCFYFFYVLLLLLFFCFFCCCCLFFCCLVCLFFVFLGGLFVCGFVFLVFFVFLGGFWGYDVVVFCCCFFRVRVCMRVDFKINTFVKVKNLYILRLLSTF